MMQLPRLSWNMSEDGVVEVWATDERGRMFSLLDIFRRPMIERGGMTKHEARAFQCLAAERICEAWNNDQEAAKIAEDHKIDPALGGEAGLTDWGNGHNAACDQIAYSIRRRFQF